MSDPKDGPTGDPDADGPANINDADFYDHRLAPGGPTPAKTPGGTGPSTRDAENAVTDDANEDIVKREELGGGLRTPWEQGDK